MSAPTFTPGPWVLATAESPEGTVAHISTVRAGMGAPVWHVAEICGWGFDFDNDPVQQANARLIAAAPDLLMALKMMGAAYPGPDGSLTASMQEAEDAARAAIAKAEGRS